MSRQVLGEWQILSSLCPPPYASIQHWHSSDGLAGTVPKSLLSLIDLLLATNLWGSALLLPPFLQMGKPRYREVKKLAQSHTVSVRG